MEQRKITVVSTRDHIRKTFMSSARTLNELKAEMTSNGIEHEGLSYFEGLTKAEYKDGSSVLPQVVAYKDPNTGEDRTTTELIFILSQPNKKIKSGSCDRIDVYARIKSMGLVNECQRVYGKNFTQVSTDDLLKLINAHTECKTTVEETADSTISSYEMRNLQNQIDDLRKAIEIIVWNLTEICKEDKDNIDALIDEIRANEKQMETQIEETGVQSDLPDDIFESLDSPNWIL